jgi:secretion/DNA translocation related TadE-like protein
VDVIARDRGAATVWSLALVNVLLLGGLVAAAVGALAVTRQRAATVADVAAVAGAQAVVDPCAEATAVVAANGMTMVSCESDGVDVVVDVSATAPPVVSRLLGLLGRSEPEIRASARAGPP